MFSKALLVSLVASALAFGGDDETRGLKKVDPTGCGANVTGQSVAVSPNYEALVAAHPALAQARWLVPSPGKRERRLVFEPTR
jgi:hypothetical protein